MEKWWKAEHGGARWASLTTEDRSDFEDFTGCIPSLLSLVSLTQLPWEAGSETSSALGSPDSSVVVDEPAEKRKKSAAFLASLKSHISESETASHWKNMLDSHTLTTYEDKKGKACEERHTIWSP